MVCTFVLFGKCAHEILLLDSVLLIRKMRVSRVVIGQGSNGTVVYEGCFDGRQVVMKRVLKSDFVFLNREADALKLVGVHRNIVILLVGVHPNIVILYGSEADTDFVYIAVERCLCNFWNMVHHFTSVPDIIVHDPTFFLLERNDLPSIMLMILKRDMMRGMIHLHMHDFLHRDIKSQNILLSKKKGQDFSAKISDFGIAKLLL